MALAVLPMQRYRLQSELQTKVEELQLTLDGALAAQLELELARATQVRVTVGVRANPNPDPNPHPNPNPAAQTGAASRTLGGASVSE